MKTIRRFQKTVAIILAVLFSIYTSGCKIYGWQSVKQESAIQLANDPYTIFLVNAAKPKSMAWQIQGRFVDGRSLTGNISRIPKGQIEQTVYLRQKSDKNRYLFLMHIGKEYAVTLPDSGMVSIPFEQITQVKASSYSNSGRNVYENRKLEQITRSALEPVDIYVAASSGTKSKAWKLENWIVEQHQISGIITSLSEKQLKDSVHLQLKNKMVKQQLLFQLKQAYAASLPDSASVSIPFDKVEKIQVYNYDRGKTQVANTALAIPVALGIFAVVLWIALETKSQSCPFIYADNPDGRVFEGEIYSGATYPQLERHDWLPLPDLTVNGGHYRIAIANEVQGEIQHTNLLELATVDHPVGTEVLYDKYGRLHVLGDLQAPVQATDLNGADVRELVAAPDSLVFFGTPDNRSPKAEDGLLLTFQKPAAKQVRLVVEAKNSMWLDYAHGLMQDEFGVYADEVRQRQLNKSRDELQDWSLRQNIPLSVWLETAAGKWERVDYFHLVGPMAMKRDVLPLDLSRVQGEQVRIKLGYGSLFWEIDQVALDGGNDAAAEVRLLAPVSAVDQADNDRLDALSADDDRYYTQPATGDEATVVFPAPPPVPGMQRSLLLHAKGHYEILHPQTDAKPSLRYLRSFQKTNAFPVFARQKLEEYRLGRQMTFMLNTK